MIYIVISILIVLADIIAKRCAVTQLSVIESIPLWDGVFHLTYVENRGAAFGIMQNQRWFFIVITVVVLGAIIGICLKNKNKHPLFCTALAMLTGGAVGNLIDRVLYGYVVDFLDFRLINFPVFNIADIFVCTGAALLALYLVFFDNSDKKETENDGNEDN